MDFVEIALVVTGVGYLLSRRVVGDVVQLKRLLVLPLVLTAVGLSQLDHVHDTGLAGIGFLVLGLALSLVIGAVRGCTVHLGVRHGELWMRYRAATVGLWVLTIAAKVALVPLEVAVTGQPAAVATQGMLAAIGFGTLAESVVVLVRAVHRDGTVVWAKGRDGAPHRTSPAFDRVHEQVRGGGGLRGAVPRGRD